MPRRATKILRGLLFAVIVITAGITLGFLTRLGYELWFYPERFFDRDDIKGETEISAGGVRYAILPILPETAEQAAQIAALLPRYGIEHTYIGSRILVAERQIPFALDLLHVAGLGGGARYFSDQEITANPETEPTRYALQRQLAQQNALAKTLRTLTADLAAAQIEGDPAKSQIIIRLNRAPEKQIDETARSQIMRKAKEFFPADEIFIRD